MDTNGKNIVQLTRTLDRVATPSWSPDGSKIAYVSRDRDINGDSDIYVMNANAENPVNLTRNPGAMNRDPSWSPDGRRIAFESWGAGNHDIYVMDADGEHPRRLTSNKLVDDYPAWSTDGQKIAFVSRRDGNFEIYLTRPAGGKKIRLTDNPATDSNPDWFDPRFARPVEPAGKLRSIWGNIKTLPHTLFP